MQPNRDAFTKDTFRRHLFVVRHIAIIAIIASYICVCFPTIGWPEDSRSLREDAIVRAVRNASPAVVNISSEIAPRKHTNPFSAFGMDSFFDSFFKDFIGPDYPRQQKRTSLGSGVIIDGRRGYILTNAHVVSHAGAITATLNDEREFSASVVGSDPASDLAVLRIDDPEPLPSIAMGNSADLMIGETVIAIGNPFGFSNTVTTGVVSAVNRSVRSNDRVYSSFIQTDASINPGNSGGPLLNVLGELVGINTAIYAKAQGIGFAIPINKARRYVDDLIRYGKVVLPWLGIQIQDLDADLVQYHQLTSTNGVLVKALDAAGPAARAGILTGDLLLQMGNHALHSADDFWSLLRDYASNDTISFSVLRGRQKRTVELKTKPFPEDRGEYLAEEMLGVKVASLDQWTHHHPAIEPQRGVVIMQVLPGSYLDRIGAQKGDVIRRIDDVAISGKADFLQAIVRKRTQKSMVVLIQRGSNGYYITVETDPVA